MNKNKLEKFLAKANEQTSRKEITVTIDGDEWKVRQLNLSELRECERMADKGEKTDWFLYNDARLVKATEHDFPWNQEELKKAYKVGTKYELVEKIFRDNPEGYTKLLNAVREVNATQTEEEAIEEAKN
ncbi:hypothetical protein HPY28_18565 [Brevibacillus sp. HB1.2]|uniref:phage tail assembly chaperone n=1 Tax=Brevibacillus TaxID=55080 RepID=UPI00156ACFE7|nr:MULTISPECIES: hypothetical protein [unclassified Brevibacillus]NRS19475.1 hypothetical protein [Brevibacillus sp. HB1.4B]NTU22330.1 hypothetical protein [Brevibacillus sp. HB1.2]